MAEGKTKITALGQLTPKTDDYDITNSSTGEVFTVTLRDLVPDEIAALNARRKRVKPPVVGFKGKDAYGTPIPQTNEDDPQYLKDVEEAFNDYVYQWLLLTWVVTYPADADTPDKKLTLLKQTIPQWAFSELNRRLREISGLKMSDVALEKKRSRETPSANANTALVESAAGQ